MMMNTGSLNVCSASQTTDATDFHTFSRGGANPVWLQSYINRVSFWPHHSVAVLHMMKPFKAKYCANEVLECYR